MGGTLRSISAMCCTISCKPVLSPRGKWTPNSSSVPRN
jgi:hypothetical protein